MNPYSVSHLPDSDLVHGLTEALARLNQCTADSLAHLGEIDARQLYEAAGYSSTDEYCVMELHYDEDEALERVYAARAARRFPAIFEAVAEGRLDLTTVVFVAPHLTEDMADELLAAAAGKSHSELAILLAGRLVWASAAPSSALDGSSA